MFSHNRYILFFLSYVLYLQLFSQSSHSLIRFTENKHQWEDFIHYKAQLDGGALYVESNTLTYGFYDKETFRNSVHGNSKTKSVKEIRTTGFKVSFLNSNANPLIESYNPSKDYNNYFIGSDKSKWAGNAKNYQKLLYKDLWNNINLEMLGQNNSVKYNFYVKPGGDAENIQLYYDKTESISLQKKQLIIKTSLNELVEHEPYAYQIINGKTIEVPCNFKLKKNTVSFSFPKDYDKNYELVIDPVLVFAASSGSTADNFGFCATYDSQGNLYSGSIAFGPNYPVVNAYDATFNGVITAGLVDVAITKYDSSGTFLHYSTYLGGANSSETVTSLIVDAQNHLYLFGATGSNDFPITSGAYDNTFDGGIGETFTGSGTYFNSGSDIYVAELSAGGNQLLASTFIGGSDNDGLNINNVPSTSGGEAGPDSLEYNYGDQYRGEILLDNMGNPVISSCSRSANFPIKHGFDSTLGGWQDAVLFKFNPGLSQLLWSTFIGGSNNDGGYGIVIGKDNKVYTTGGTRSTDFPAKPTAYQPAYMGGMCDGYITKISQNGDSLLAATYIGTNDYDQSFFIQLDKNQNVYVYGQALGIMPVIACTYSNTNGAQFVAKLNNNLSSIIYSTILGDTTGTGQINISPTAFLIDYCENVYVSGWGGNFKTGLTTFNMPLTSPTIQSSNVDGFNFYMMQLSRDCNSLLFSTYYGGAQSFEHCHGGTSRYDKRGIVYQSLCTGCGSYQDFPLYPSNVWPTSITTYTNGAWAWPGGGCNNATFKINFSPAIIVANFTANNYGCSPLTVNFHNASVGATAYFWNFGGTDTTSSILNPIRTYTAAGTYTAQLMVYNPTTCNLSDTSFITITVLPSPQAAFTVIYDSCVNNAVLQNTSTFSSGTLTYSWNYGNGQTSTVINPGTINYSTGTYTASLMAIGSNGCTDSIKQPLHFTIDTAQVYPDTALCYGKSVQLHASGGITYIWQPSATLSNANSANPLATPTANTIYTVTISEIDGGGRTCNYILRDSIKLYPQTTAAFSYNVNSCGNTVTFKDSSYLNITSWHWNFGDSTAIDSTKNPVHSYEKPGTYTVTLVVNNQYNCPDSIKKVLTLIHFNPISISKSVTVCNGKKVQLNASGGISYTWTPSYNLDSAYVHDPIATPTATTHYTLYITQVNSLGDTCGPSILHTNITVPVYSSSVLAVYASPDTIIDGNSSQLSTSLSSGYIVWTPDYNLSNDSSLTPMASPHHTTTYNAIYIDPNGCVFRLNSVTIYVLDASCNENTVFVPNTFTPNNDGRNDILYARSAFVTDIYFTIYDRWGEQVFATNDINKGWDGIFNGKPCNPDVFGYYVKFKCNDGKESFKKGNVTLIR